MRMHGRVSRLEKEQRRKVGDLPYLTVQQDIEDAGLFRDSAGNTYRTEDLERLSESHNLIKLVYAEDWGGEPQPGELRISLKWGDEDETEEGHL